MSQDSKIALVTVLMIGTLLQIILAAGAAKDSPHEAAIAFTKAYFGLCPDLAATMTNNGMDEDENDVAGDYLYDKSTEAAARGYDISRLSRMFYNIHTKTISKDAATAAVEIHGTVRIAINPVFGFVGKLFFLTEPADFKEKKVLNLVKENGKWKVTPEAINILAEAV